MPVRANVMTLIGYTQPLRANTLVSHIRFRCPQYTQWAGSTTILIIQKCYELVQCKNIAELVARLIWIPLKYNSPENVLNIETFKSWYYGSHFWSWTFIRKAFWWHNMLNARWVETCQCWSLFGPSRPIFRKQKRPLKPRFYRFTCQCISEARSKKYD